MWIENPRTQLSVSLSSGERKLTEAVIDLLGSCWRPFVEAHVTEVWLPLCRRSRELSKGTD